MFYSRCFYLLTAPPAWGKTRLFREWTQQNAVPFLYVSPLRALANEVMDALADHPGLLRLRHLGDHETWQHWRAPAGTARILVVTPELIRGISWESLARDAPNATVVWDEIHLVQLWGLSFREAMLEEWWGFCTSGLCGVGLTATADEGFCEFLCESLNGYGWSLVHGDAGNFCFKRPPTQRRYFPRRVVPLLISEVLERRADSTLIFCAHRDEVDQWVKWCERQGIRALGCKGGGTETFRQQLAQASGTVNIFATSCLSHGVNLPTLARVILAYEEKNPALLHQMITRGGRRGESYEVWQVGPLSSWFNRHLPVLAQRVVVAQVALFMGEWWNATRGPCDSDYSPERARPGCATSAARWSDGLGLCLRGYGWWKKRQAASLRAG